MNVKTLKTIPEGSTEAFESILIYKKGNLRLAKNGSEFLMVELGDKTGSFMVTCFNDSQAFNFFKDVNEGCIVKIVGFSDHYQGRFSPKVSQLEVLSEEQLQDSELLDNLVECSPENPVALWDELMGYVNLIENQGLRATILHVLEEVGNAFKEGPAAIGMHHAYRNGLLEHTVHVTRAGIALLPLYPEVHRDLAITGMILHDVGKTIEYDGGLTIKKTKIGMLQGHVILGYRIVRKAAMQCKLEANLLERLEHIILSHQGELEWGAAIMAATPEAVFVSMVDNLDAKMGMVQQALRQTPVSDLFSEKLPGLKSSILVQSL